MPHRLCVALVLLLPVTSGAQIVRGIVSTAGARPVAGAVVQLLDTTSAIAADTLTNGRGEFRLAASPGTYRLRASGVGFRSVTSPPFVLRSGEGVLERLTLTGTILVVRAEIDGGRAAPANARVQVTPSSHVATSSGRQRDKGAVFSGVVLADSTRLPIAEAEVALPQLSKRMLTNERGEFRVADIPAGTHRVIIRRIGYGPYDGSLVFEPNGSLERQVVLTRMAVLDTVVVSAKRTAIPSFDEHRRTGLGRFLTREQLAPQEGRRLADILTEVSGVDVVTGRGNHSWLATTRGTRSLNAASCELDRSDAIAGAKFCACYAQVYLDAMLVYRGDPGEPLFDLNRMLPAQIEAIEFYAGPAQTPLRYSGLNSACGVLVIHTRRSP